MTTETKGGRDVHRGSKRHHIYEQIKELIRSEELGRGPITETTIAKRLNVSRTPVREALLQLKVEGWLEDSEDGLNVRVLQDAAFEETYTVREALEGAAARLAASRATPGELLAMQELARDFADAVKNEKAIATLDTLNARFHMLLHRSSHSELLERILEPLQLAVGRFTRSTFVYPSRASSSAEEHERLVAALRARDAEQAEAIARAHVRAGGEVRAQLVAEDLVSG